MITPERQDGYLKKVLLKGIREGGNPFSNLFNYQGGFTVKRFKWVKSLIIFVLLMWLMVVPCHAVMIPQDVRQETFTKTLSNPTASSYSLIYSFTANPYYVYRFSGTLSGSTISNHNHYWQIRDESGNVLYSAAVGTSNRAVSTTLATPVRGIYFYAYSDDASYSSEVFNSCGAVWTTYYGSDVADQNTAEQTLTAANTAATNATTASTNASTAASRALNNYNILNNSTKGLYKTYDVASVAATNTTYGGNTAAYWAYVAYSAGNSDTTAPIIKKISGQNGATCTTSGTFNVVVSASDNSGGALQAQASVDGGGYGSLVTLPNSIPVLLSDGAHTITVRVQDEAGNTTTETMTAFCL